MKRFLYLVLVTGLLSFTNSVHEEGMFPLSYLSKLDLKDAGLKIEPEEIYSEEGTGLVNALVRLGGCTGSFISDEGLIITNHHCVYSTVASLSTPDNNYLENGFYADGKENELKAKFECKITLSFKDVSEEVLEGLTDDMTALERQKKINANIADITKAEQEQHEELKIEISEMLVGKSYTLFRYKMLEDVRIVYVPPKNIGKFGGETDNWEWPRHNGDFSIVRAYEDGKPYKPARHLKVNPSGTREGDFTFILGYPGRTYRNQPAQFLTYQQDYILPIISSWFDFRIDATKDYIKGNDSLTLKYSGTLASLSNVTKNFKGKMQGLRRTNVIAITERDQKGLKEYAKGHKVYKEYVPLFDELDSLYQLKYKLITDYLYIGQMYGSAKLFNTAANASRFQRSFANLSGKEVKTYISENEENLNKAFSGYGYADKNFSLDLILFQELVYRLSQSNYEPLKVLFTNQKSDKTSIYAYAYELYTQKKYAEKARSLLDENNYRKFIKIKTELTEFAANIDEVYVKLSSMMESVNAEIDAIIPKLNDIEQEMNMGSFVPDANGTLRFTYGYVKGYKPEDAVYFSPYTTVNGIIEKASSTNPDYYLQPEIVKHMKEVEPADVLKHPTEKQVVVAFLYNMDTTGGNSGSPIMDAYGNIVGINFDRAYTATINDYAWNEVYSRSIGVDIRYVLYVMKYFGGADDVLKEMGVEL